MIDVGKIEIIGPNEDVKRLIDEIVKQNSEIIKMNKEILKLALSPGFIVNKNIGQDQRSDI